MILRMLVPFLLMLIIPDSYLYPCYIRRLTQSKVLRIVWWLPTIILGAFMTVAFIMHVQHEWFMSYCYIFMLAFIVPKMIFMLCSLLGKAIGFYRPAFRSICDKIGMVLAVFLLAILSYGCIWGWKQLTVKEITLTYPELPAAFDGYRVVQFTDLHIGTLAGKSAFIERLAQFVNDQKGDIILFTGDLVNGNPNELEPDFIKSLQKLKAPDGVYSIMGNHDYCTYGHYANKAAEEAAVKEVEDIERDQLHWDLLLNENRIIRRGNDSIALLGVENDGIPPFPELGDLPKTQQGLSKGCFKLLMSHDPTHWRRKVLPQTDIPIMLAGHTHAAQFKIGNFTPASFTYKEAYGLFTEGNRSLFVSGGIGEVMFPFRFGAWPEVVVITLKKK